MKKINLISTLKKTGIAVAISAPIMVSSAVFFPAYAMGGSPVLTRELENVSVTSTPTQGEQQRMESLKTRAAAEIDRRVDSMTDLISRVNADKRLTQTEKDTFTSTLQKNIDDLKALKTKIQSDTDFTTLKADVKSIVDAYRIFAILEPQLRTLKAVDNQNTTYTNLQTLASKLNDRIQTAKTAGKDVSNLTNLYNDMLSKLSAAQPLFNTAESLVKNLTPESYPAKDTLTTAKNDLQTSAQDLRAAAQDARNIVAGLKAFNTTPTVSPTL